MITITRVLITEGMIRKVTEVVMKIILTVIKMTYKAKSMEKKEILICTRDCPVKRDGNIFCLKLPALKELSAFKDRSWLSLQINDLRKYFR